MDITTIKIITYIVAAITLTGTIANAYQRRWGFLIWIFTNLFWIIYNIYIKEYAQAVIYSVNCITACFGFYNWGKINKINDISK